MKSPQNFDTDVVVVGGGPAGSTAAALLAGRGWRVTLLEKEHFPRFQIGESLLPYNNDLFRELGVSKTLSERGFVDKTGAEFVTADGTVRQKFIFGNSLPAEYARSFQVKRSEFDQILLDAARSHGAQVIEGARVVKVDLNDPSSCEVSYRDDSGVEAKIRGRFLIDASGAEGKATSSVVKRSERPGLKKIAFFAHYANARPSCDGSRDITIVVLRDGWCWIIPVDETTTSFGVVLDSSAWKQSGLDKDRILEETITSSPYLRDRIGGAEQTTEVYARKDFSYTVDRLFGRNFALVGDAAGFIDPIFSTGVFIAMTSSRVAVEAIDRRLRDGSLSSLKRYERVMRRILGRYLRFIEHFYRREFIEIFLNPHPQSRLVKIIVVMLAGNAFQTIIDRWGLEWFYMLVRIQERRPLIAPRLAWDKLPSVRGERVSEVNVV